MERLLDACRQARLQGLTEREAVAWLAARGFERIDETAYSVLVARSDAAPPAARLRRFAQEAPRMHADSILNLTAIREELWRQYYGIRDPPSEDAEITPTERARIGALNAQARARILSAIKDVEPLISAYAEAAVIRERRDALDASALAASSPATAAAPPPPPSAPNIPPAARANDPDDKAWRAVPDPAAPGVLTLVPAQ